MKTKIKFLLLLALFTAIPFISKAQLAISLKMNRNYYLQYETVYAKVKVRNDSGHAVVFGKDKRLQGKLLFKIVTAKGVPVSTISKTPYPMEGIIINAGQSKEFIIPISRFYDLKPCGTYRLYAYIEHNMFQDVYRSNDGIFEVNAGITSWKRTVGIPEFMMKGKKKKVSKRTYRMVTLIAGSQKSNYLVIEDKKRIYTVLFLSTVLGEEHIKHEVDHLSRLHLMIPMSPKIFVYLVIDPMGKIDEETVYKRTNTVPSMVRSPKTGKIYVTGGAKAKRQKDYR